MARQLAAQHGLKYVPVHHMEAHALVARACAAVTFPFLCLLVSGGHNLLVVVHGVGRYTLLGSTLDDAVGAFCIWPRTARCCAALSPATPSSF
jgi:tRNA A37 threonylcarbamoyltransferase TsaD